MHDLDNVGLGALLKTALDAVVVMRLDGTVAGWNDVAERTFGWTFAEASGRRMSEMIIPPAYRDAHERGLAHYLATGEGPVLDQHIEITALHRDGRTVPVELSITRTEQFDETVFLGFLRDISERHEATRRQALMIGELNHRVKNLLGVVAGIAHQTARSVPDLPTFIDAFGGRLSSLACAHEILTADTWERAPLRTLADTLLGSYTEGTDAQIRIDGPDLSLAPRQLLGVSMILHELTSNAVKYGALSRAGGRVKLEWQVDGRHVHMFWVETGLSGLEPPTRQGFGSKMIAITASHDLHGQANMEWRGEGLRFCLSFILGSE